MIRTIKQLSLCSFLALAGWTAQAGAATITVTTLDDTVAIDGMCSLREAIVNANTDSAGDNPDCAAGTAQDLINLKDLTGTILLTSNLPIITASVIVQGPGKNKLTLDGADNYRIFGAEFDDLDNPDPDPIKFSGLTFVRANNAIRVSDAKLTITYCIFRNNHATNGGAVYTTAPTTIKNSIFVDNEATDYGGAIWSSMGDGDFYGYGPLVVEKSVFRGNYARYAGGALYVLGDQYDHDSKIESSEFFNNGTNSQGGAIYLSHEMQMTIENSAIYNNTSAVRGGGLYSVDADLVIANTTFSGNHADMQGGGIFFVNRRQMHLVNVTVTNNNATEAGGGIYLYYEGFRGPEISNSIVAGNTAAGAYGGDADCVATAPLVSTGYNVFGENTGCSGPAATDQTIDPTDVASVMLRPLANNGGRTRTHALIENNANPALSGGNPSGCSMPDGTLLTTDQRKVSRPAPGAGACDIGAFENQRF